MHVVLPFLILLSLAKIVVHGGRGNVKSAVGVVQECKQRLKIVELCKDTFLRELRVGGIGSIDKLTQSSDLIHRGGYACLDAAWTWSTCKIMVEVQGPSFALARAMLRSLCRALQRLPRGTSKGMQRVDVRRYSS